MQSLLNTCLYDVCSLILTYPHAPRARSHLHSAGLCPSHTSFHARPSCPHSHENSSSSGTNVTISGQSYNLSSWHHFHCPQVNWWSSFICQKNSMAYVTGYCHIGSQRAKFPHRCGQEDRTLKEAWEGRGPAEWRHGLAWGPTHQPNIGVRLREKRNQITPAYFEGNLFGWKGRLTNLWEIWNFAHITSQLKTDWPPTERGSIFPWNLCLHNCTSLPSPGPCTYLRYMWALFSCFIFHVLQLLPIKFPHNSIHVALVNLQWNTCKNRFENQTYHDVVMVIESASLLVSSPDT
jgi:hypothetical protein